MTRAAAVALAALLAVAGCTPAVPPATDADVIVIGAGIAGLAAALEAESSGARVLVIEANSLGGGHAVKAGGFALVDTPLQRARGWRDSPDAAFRDLMSWGEDADPWWTRHYADHAREQVHDWLTAMGVKFMVLIDTPEDSVPRFHFTAGTAVNAVVPMIREALRRERIEFLWNTEVTGIVRRDGEIAGVRTASTRSGEKRSFEAPAVIIATGGYQGSLDMVRRTWGERLPAPERLLNGAGAFATGSGLKLAEPFGAALSRLDHQVTFVNGLPDPRDPSGEHGLAVHNPGAIWVDSSGRRFTNEAAPSKVTERAVLRQRPATHWLVFDARSVKQLAIRGAAWLNARTIRQEIIDNPALVKKADTIPALAQAADLPVDALKDTVQRFNVFVEKGSDTDFGRIGPGTAQAALSQIREPPFYAIQLFPMTRKSMGGLVIDQDARVLGGAGQLIRGLFAAGEVTGVAGINGSYGGSGTFLGPSVLTGRIAGRNAAALALGPGAVLPTPVATPTQTVQQTPRDAQSMIEAREPIDLAALLNEQRRGYWHFNVSHALVMERGDGCATCHKDGWPESPATTRAQRLVQLDSCTRCH